MLHQLSIVFRIIEHGFCTFLHYLKGPPLLFANSQGSRALKVLIKLVLSQDCVFFFLHNSVRWIYEFFQKSNHSQRAQKFTVVNLLVLLS